MRGKARRADKNDESGDCGGKRQNRHNERGATMMSPLLILVHLCSKNHFTMEVNTESIFRIPPFFVWYSVMTQTDFA
jgi:hypothetical protein